MFGSTLHTVKVGRSRLPSPTRSEAIFGQTATNRPGRTGAVGVDIGAPMLFDGWLWHHFDFATATTLTCTSTTTSRRFRSTTSAHSSALTARVRLSLQ